jgi:transcription elongation factor Elf1
VVDPEGNAANMVDEDIDLTILMRFFLAYQTGEQVNIASSDADNLIELGWIKRSRGGHLKLSNGIQLEMLTYQINPKKENYHSLVREFARRRASLIRLRPLCPACYSESVVLCDWGSGRGRWICRICTEAFDLDLQIVSFRCDAAGEDKLSSPGVSRESAREAHDSAFRQALESEYSAGWPYYNDETRQRLGAEAVRLNLDVIYRAMDRAGLSFFKMERTTAPPLSIRDEEDRHV